MTAGTAEPPHADAITDLPVVGCLTDLGNPANDLMTGDYWCLVLIDVPFDLL